MLSSPAPPIADAPRNRRSSASALPTAANDDTPQPQGAEDRGVYLWTVLSLIGFFLSVIAGVLPIVPGVWKLALYARLGAMCRSGLTKST